MTPKEIKKIKGEMTAQDFGLLVGVSTVTIWRWNCGSAKPEGASLRLLELIRDNRRIMIRLLSRCAQEKMRVV